MAFYIEVYTIIVHTSANQLLPQLLMEQFDTLPRYNVAGFPQALEIMENLENHEKVPCMEKSLKLKITV